ncbi:MAG: hypothetical protein AAGL66_03360, partial [Pseudomonadota bacterium]
MARHTGSRTSRGDGDRSRIFRCPGVSQRRPNARWSRDNRGRYGREPGTFYLGASGGGVWKSTDYGESWDNVSDGYFASPSIGDISVSQSDANIVYVGTGSDGLRSNVIRGKGVYRSRDGGRGWELVGLEDSGHIGAVEIDPRNNNVVWVAAIG